MWSAACRIPFSPSRRRAIEFASELACEPRDRMSRAGIAFPAIPAVRTRHRSGDIERGSNMRVPALVGVPVRAYVFSCAHMCTRSIVLTGISTLEFELERKRGSIVLAAIRDTHPVVSC